MNEGDGVDSGGEQYHVAGPFCGGGEGGGSGGGLMPHGLPHGHSLHFILAGGLPQLYSMLQA